jgi:hypothetical protein
LRSYATSWKVAGSNPDEVIVFLFNVPIPSSHTMALGLAHPLTEISTRNFLGRGEEHKADNLTAIYEPIVYNNGGPINYFL